MTRIYRIADLFCGAGAGGGGDTEGQWRGMRT